MDLRLKGKVAVLTVHMPLDGARGKAIMDQ
jgi:hypothetical protein